MLAVVMDRFEDCSRARIAEVPTPQPARGEVLIRVVAAGVNPVDWKEAEGHLAEFFPFTFPFVLGYDAAGLVEEIGPGVVGIAIGDAVMVFSDRFRGHHGTFAEYVCVSADLVADMPKTISYIEAASIPCAGMTGYQCLFRSDKGNLQASDTVLIHGASGGIGSFAVQFASQLGVKVAATCGKNNAVFVESLGADTWIDSRSDDIGEQVRKWSPKGVSAVIDCVGMNTLSLTQAMRAMKRGGRLISVSTLTDDGDVTGETDEAERNGFLKIQSRMNFDDLRNQFRPVTTLIDNGEIKIPPIDVCSPKAVAELLHRFKEGHNTGKTVLDLSLSFTG